MSSDTEKFIPGDQVRFRETGQVFTVLSVFLSSDSELLVTVSPSDDPTARTLTWYAGDFEAIDAP